MRQKRTVRQSLLRWFLSSLFPGYQREGLPLTSPQHIPFQGPQFPHHTLTHASSHSTNINILGAPPSDDTMLIAGVIPLLCSQPEGGQTHSGYGLSSNSSSFGPLSPALPPSRATWKVTQVKLGDRDVHTKHSLPKPAVWHPAWYQWFGRPSKHLSSQNFLPLNNNLILPLTKGKNTSLQSSLASRTTLSPVHMQVAI